MKFLLVLLIVVCYTHQLNSLPLEEADDEFVGAGWGGPNSVELTDADLEKNVENPEENWMWIVYRPACGNCKRTKGDWVKAAKALKGSNVKMGHIDCDKNQKYWKYFNEGFTLPQIVFMSKDDKSGDKKYTESNKSAANLEKWANENAV